MTTNDNIADFTRVNFCGFLWIYFFLGWGGGRRFFHHQDNGRTAERSHFLWTRSASSFKTDLLEVREQEVEVEGQRGDEVDDVDRRAEERQLVGADDQSDEQLEREPAVAGALDVEERLVRVRALLVEQPPRRRAQRHVPAGEAVAGTVAYHLDPGRQGEVLDRRHPHVGVRLEAERQDRDDDEEHGQRGYDLRDAQRIFHLIQSISRSINILNWSKYYHFASVAEWLQYLVEQRKDRGSNAGSAICLQ